MSLESGGEISLLYVAGESERAAVGAEFLERTDDRFTVETATQVSDGIDYLSAKNLDCIVSEYRLQGWSGVEFLEAVREVDSDLPFILFTGKGSEDVANDAISAGVTDYMQKEQGADEYVELATRLRNTAKQAESSQTASATLNH